jgi:hypothetical protein
MAGPFDSAGFAASLVAGPFDSAGFAASLVAGHLSG